MRSCFARSAVFFAVMLAVVAPALGDPLGACSSVESCTPLAELGNADAQRELGWMYENRQGVPQDYAAAAKWYSLAAEQGDANARNLLGLMYEEGRGVPQDYNEAVKWYSAAAEQSDPYAQFNLGKMYLHGWGVAQDYVQAHMLFNIAFSQSQHPRHRRFRDEVAALMTAEKIAESQRLAREWITAHPK